MPNQINQQNMNMIWNEAMSNKGKTTQKFNVLMSSFLLWNVGLLR